MSEPNEDLKWEVLLRYRYIEIIVLWEGRLTTNHLCNTFGIKRQQASRDINQYKTLAPDNLAYDTSLKGYTPAPSFRPIFTTGYVDEYLNLLDSHSLLDGFVQRIELPSANTFVIRAPQRRAEPEIVRMVVEACRTKQRLELTYASMTNPLGEDRIIAPHALVSSGYRWHVRAYCEKNRDYRDFVLGRILECGDLMGDVEYELPEDQLWQECIELTLIPNPHLTPEQQALVRHERCFNGPTLTLETRKATAIYMLQLLQVPTSAPASDSPDNVNANPLVLEDYKLIEELKFEQTRAGRANTRH
ncbi:helix-turn-helix transcriptional regulator [Marinobacterium lutimaris]|uniref:WYL domain-containing protein n=1 Tax=Marinobacterium lutimaris TaxID=568106 RepID=A0A1H5VU79_9GAMM|nr:WYL domain-containing protein [Marinobacterium lutimaris]SEF90117.1 WYL domain-containing protein [Marinobacterium lutimaris]